MNLPPDPETLLDSVLSEGTPPTDGIAPILDAVRARRRRRRLVPVATALLALISITAWRFLSPDPRPPTAVHGSSPVASADRGVESAWAEPSPKPEVTAGPIASASSISTDLADVLTRIHSTPLKSDEWVRSASDDIRLARVRSESRPEVRATDDELLALAGGRGVALARMADGRKELLVADTRP